MLVDSNSIQNAIRCLKTGGVIVTPSESCYGLSCDADNASAVEKMNAIKGHRAGMSLTLLVATLEQVEQYGALNEAARHLSRAFHPGQLNLIIPQKDQQKHSYLSPSGIAFRIPDNQVLIQLINQFGAPITTTSANTHAAAPLYSYKDVRDQFKNSVCSIINAGDLDTSVTPSTVYDTRTNSILRAGPITLEQIQSELQ